MDVNSIMNTYSLNSLWSSINPSNSSSIPDVPLIGNVNLAVQENYSSMNYFGQTTGSELQDIFEKVEPSYGIPLTYDQNGNFTIPSSTELPVDGLTPADTNIISLLNSSNSSADSLTENILSQYNSIESGTFTPNLSSILSSNPYNVYGTVNSLGSNGTVSPSILNASA